MNNKLMHKSIEKDELSQQEIIDLTSSEKLEASEKLDDNCEAFTAVYDEQVFLNTQAMIEALQYRGIDAISGGSESHIALVDIGEFVENEKVAQELLQSVNISCDANSLQAEKLSSFNTSGIRISTLAITARGFGELEAKMVGHLISDVLLSGDDANTLQQTKEMVHSLAEAFPIKTERIG